VRSSVSNIKSISDINPRTGEVTVIPSTRYNEFISASQPPSQMAYTDNLRLRDEQSNFNTRLIEYKNQLENEKSLLENRQKSIEDDIDYSKKAVTHELQKLSNRINDTANTEWVDDNTDVAPTFGSDDFRPQTSRLNKTPQVNYEDVYPNRGGLNIEDLYPHRNEMFSSGKYGVIPDDFSYQSGASPLNEERFGVFDNYVPTFRSPSPTINRSNNTSSRFSMPAAQSEDEMSVITEQSLPPPPKRKGRPKSTIPLKERRKAQYQKQKAKRAAAQL